jgi:hypothetical protein
VSFIGLVAYVASIVKRWSIVDMDPKLSGIKLLSILGYLFFIPVFIWLLVYQLWQFFQLIGYLLLPFISFLLQKKLQGEGWSYLDFVRKGMTPEIFKIILPNSKGQFDPLLKKILSRSIQAFALIGEIYLFTYFQPSFSMIIWLYFVYFFTIFTLEATYNLSELLNVLSSDYNKFILKNGVVEGFVISRDQDHYYLMTEYGTKSIFTSNILEMSHLTPSELIEWKKRASQKIDESKQRELPK